MIVSTNLIVLRVSCLMMRDALKIGATTWSSCWSSCTPLLAPEHSSFSVALNAARLSRSRQLYVASQSDVIVITICRLLSSWMPRHALLLCLSSCVDRFMRRRAVITLAEDVGLSSMTVSVTVELLS